MRIRFWMTVPGLGRCFLSIVLLAGLMFCGVGCGEGGGGVKSKPGAGGKIKVTCTTTIVADLVKQVGGDEVEIVGLMGPGVDPHLYKATASDVAKLRGADVIFYNGLQLEGKLQDVFVQLARSKKFVYAVVEELSPADLIHPEDAAAHADPHVWFDVMLWRRCVDAVVRGLSDFSPDRAEVFKARGIEVQRELQALHDWASAEVAQLPKEKRILVTSHDAYGYFGKAYGFQVVALQGISTVDEISLAAMAKLVDFIKEKKIGAIFVESSVSPDAIKRISEDSGAVVGGELFSDAMGTPGQMENGYDLGTYDGMVRHNLTTIVGALK